MRVTDESRCLITHEFSKISFFIFFRQCWWHRRWASSRPAIPVHSALLLVLAFFTSAGLWLLLEAEFLAITLVLVYVGRGNGVVPFRGDDAGYQPRPVP